MPWNAFWYQWYDKGSYNIKRISKYLNDGKILPSFFMYKIIVSYAAKWYIIITVFYKEESKCH